MATENIKLGVCSIFYDGVDLGLTKGGVEVEVSTDTHEITVDQFGNTPVGELINGRNVMATVPLVETTLDNLLTIMPGSTLVTDGVFGTGTITFSSSAPSNNDRVTILGQKFTFKTTPVAATDIPIPAGVNEAAQALADEINGATIDVSATVAGAVVTVTANSRSAALNSTITTNGSNIAVTGITGGIDPTLARVDVQSGTSINLLSIAKKLLLRPVGTTGADDFIIWKSAAPGALSFTYAVDQERIFTATFKGYVDTANSNLLFSVGDEDAA